MRLRPAVLCAGLLVAGAPGAQAADRPTVAVDFDGCATIVDTGKVFAEFSLDLGADQLQPTTVVTLDGAPPEAQRLLVRCADKSFEVILRIDARPPESLWLSDTSSAIRARTLALALAERIRQIRLEPPPAPPPAPVAVVAAAVAESARPRVGPFQDPRRTKLEWQLATGLAALTVVGFSVGSPIAAVGDAETSSKGGGLRGAGATILGLSCAPLIGGAVAFGLWMRDRSLPVQ